MDRKKRVDEENATHTRLQSLDIDIREPLSTVDWENLSQIIMEVNALAWF